MYLSHLNILVLKSKLFFGQSHISKHSYGVFSGYYNLKCLVSTPTIFESGKIDKIKVSFPFCF